MPFVFPDIQLDEWDNLDWRYYNRLILLSDIEGKTAESLIEFVELLRKTDPAITPIGLHQNDAEDPEI